MKFKVLAALLLLIVCTTCALPFAGASVGYPNIDYAYIKSTAGQSTSDIVYTFESTSDNITFLPRTGSTKFTRNSTTAFVNTFYTSIYYDNHFNVSSDSSLVLSRTSSYRVLEDYDRIKIVLNNPASISLIFANSTVFHLWLDDTIIGSYSTTENNGQPYTFSGFEYSGTNGVAYHYSYLELAAGTYYITRANDNAARFVNLFVQYDIPTFENITVDENYYVIYPYLNNIYNETPFTFIYNGRISSPTYELTDFKPLFGNWNAHNLSYSIPIGGDTDKIRIYVDNDYTNLVRYSTFILVGTDIYCTINNRSITPINIDSGVYQFNVDSSYNPDETGVILQYFAFNGLAFDNFQHDDGYYFDILSTTPDFEFYALYIITPSVVQPTTTPQDYFNYGFEYANKNIIYNSASYIQGKWDGIDSAGNYTFLGLISAVIDAPIRAIFGYETIENGVVVVHPGLLTFDVFGYDMSNFVLTLFSIAIVLAVLRIIRGI